MLSNLEIIQSARKEPIVNIAGKIGLMPNEIELYGNDKAKISLDVLPRIADNPSGKYIVVTAITPTPLGEGKTVTAIGLSMALNRIGKRAVACIRQPSMGPVFGIKGGGTGGGYSQVVPADDLNLHFTGDMHAVSTAHNLLAAFLDAHIHHGNALNLDLSTVSFPRVIDLNDRVLRHIVVGLGGKENGLVRETGFDLTPASEVMAILALASDLQDLRHRLGKIIVGVNREGAPVTAEELKCAGAMAVLLKDAIKPNLIQTLENTPCLVHAGPFANIAHGNNSILADKIAIKLADYVVTEAGFGADIGAEKFFNIKCRYSGQKPDAAVLVCTIRALKAHSEQFRIILGRPLPSDLLEENLPAIEAGGANLIKQIENIQTFRVPVVVAINRMPEDTEAEIDTVKQLAMNAGADDAVVSDVFAKGGAGGVELAEAVVSAAEKPSRFKPLYSEKSSIRKKIETIATQMYGATDVEYLPGVRTKIKQYEGWGFGHLPICMAKTPLSLSHDPNLKGRPTDFSVPVRDIFVSAGAGFLYALLGEVSTMPGLPSSPRGQIIDIDAAGNPVNLL
jgi:formate--tetrahydrofolate ligase